MSEAQYPPRTPPQLQPSQGDVYGWMADSSRAPAGSSASGSPTSQGRGGAPTVDSGHGRGEHDDLKEWAPIEHDDLKEWAPTAPPLDRLPPSEIPHLPNALPAREKGPSGKGTTSRPFQAPLNSLQASISYSLSRLLSLPRFAAFVATPLGYAQFSAYLSSLSPESEALADLELWKDALVLSRLTKQAGHGAKGIYQAYLTEEATPQIQLPDNVKHELFGALRKVRMGAPGLDAASKHLLTRLFKDEFESFVKARLLSHTKTQLSKYNLKVEDRGGVGSAFLLTNPRLRDDPIVLVSPGFCELTGYSAQQIIGRNCRFLQGKATAPEAVSNIRKRLEGGEEVMQIVLNYRADGTPFMNLLHVLPLHDLDGNLAYFLGGQTDMTRALTTGTDLSLILPEDEGLTVDMSAFTPAVQLEAREAANKPAPSPGTYAGIDIPEFPAQGRESHHGVRPKEKGGEARREGRDRHRHEGESGVHSLVTLLGCGARGPDKPAKHKGKKGVEGDEGHGGDGGEGREVGGERQQGREPLVAPTQKQTTTMPLETRILDVRVTYERLAVVKRQSREIIFTTSGFLRFLGLPSTTRTEINRSPLVYADLLDLIVAPQAPSPTSVATKDLRARVAQAFRDAVGFQSVCGLQFRKEGAGSEKAATTPVATGRLHLAPLLDLLGECVAMTVVVGA